MLVAALIGPRPNPRLRLKTTFPPASAIVRIAMDNECQPSPSRKKRRGLRGPLLVPSSPEPDDRESQSHRGKNEVNGGRPLPFYRATGGGGRMETYSERLYSQNSLGEDAVSSPPDQSAPTITQNENTIESSAVEPPPSERTPQSVRETGSTPSAKHRKPAQSVTVAWPGAVFPTALQIDENKKDLRRFRFVRGLLDAPKLIVGRQPGGHKILRVKRGPGVAYDCSYCRLNGYILRFLDRPSLYRHKMDCPYNPDPQGFLSWFLKKFECSPEHYPPYGPTPGDIYNSWYCRVCHENGEPEKKWSTKGWAKRHWAKCKYNPQRVDNPPRAQPERKKKKKKKTSGSSRVAKSDMKKKTKDKVFSTPFRDRADGLRS